MTMPIIRPILRPKRRTSRDRQQACKNSCRLNAIVLFAAILVTLLGAAARPRAPPTTLRPAPTPRPGSVTPAFPPRPAAIAPAASPAPAAPDEWAGPTKPAARLDAAKQKPRPDREFLGDNSLTDAVLAHQNDAIEPVKKQIYGGYRRSDAETGGGQGANGSAWPRLPIARTISTRRRKILTWRKIAPSRPNSSRRPTTCLNAPTYCKCAPVNWTNRLSRGVALFSPTPSFSRERASSPPACGLTSRVKLRAASARRVRSSQAFDSRRVCPERRRGPFLSCPCCCFWSWRSPYPFLARGG